MNSYSPQAVLDRAIKLCKNRTASHMLGLVQTATAEDCAQALEALRLEVQASTVIPDLWAHVDQVKAEAEAARSSARIAMAHAERVTHEHARLLEALEDSLALLAGTAHAKHRLCLKYGVEGGYLPAMLELRQILATDWAELIAECHYTQPTEEVAA